VIPTGIFKVDVYECYASQMPANGKVNVVLVDSFPLLQAERAASKVGRLLGSSGVQLGRLDTGKGTMYSCIVMDVPVKELEKWQD
jgi:hypothetical protein